MSGPPAEIWDVGLQPERTALAWRRTSASLAVLCCGLVKVTASSPAHVAATMLSVGAATAAFLLVLGPGRRRFAVVVRALHGGSAVPGLALPALLLSATLATSAIALAVDVALRLAG